jgi:hypothetical protein
VDSEHAEIERRLGRPIEAVRDRLCEMFSMEWEEVEVIIETSADKGDRSRADVIVGLVERTEAAPPVQQRVKRAAVRWIGKPWRERENPWDRFKDRLPEAPPPTGTDEGGFEEWTPLRGEDD